MEKTPVLVILKVEIELLVPNNSARSLDVYQFQEECVSHEIIDQGYGPRQPRKRPFVGIRVRNVQTGHSSVHHLVRVLGHCSFYLLLISIFEESHGRRTCAKQNVREFYCTDALFGRSINLREYQLFFRLLARSVKCEPATLTLKTVMLSC